MEHLYGLFRTILSFGTLVVSPLKGLAYEVVPLGKNIAAGLLFCYVSRHIKHVSDFETFEPFF